MRLTTRQKMTLARAVQRPVLGARRLRGRGPRDRVRRGGVQWELDLREGIDFSIWLRGYFEPSTVKAYRRLVGPGDTVLDIGANVGAHTLHLATAVGPNGWVVAFEPSAEAFTRLTRNVALNPDVAPRVDLCQTMLLGSAQAALPDSVVSSWPLRPRSELDPVHPGRPKPTTGATVGTLDDTLESLGVLAVDFVKLDVDGFELDVLQGSGRLLEKSSPPILCELAPSVLDGLGRRVEDVLDLLASHRYRVQSLDGNEVTAETLAALRRSRSSMNALATRS